MNTPYSHLSLITKNGSKIIDLKERRVEQALQAQKQSVMATASHEAKWSEENIMLIKNQICPTLSKDEFDVFCYAAKRLGLDPILKQIHAVKRKNKTTGKETMAIQVGIDGYRLTADRTGLYAGSDDAIFDNEQEPNKATITVYKMVQGSRCPFTATARWSEYSPEQGSQAFMWKKMPCTMLAKVAEALALRKAFPAELSGVYTDDEMAQADKDKDDESKIVGKSVESYPSKAQLKRLFAISKSVNASPEQIKGYLDREFGKKSSSELTMSEYNKICQDLQSFPCAIWGLEKKEEITTEAKEFLPHNVPWEKYREESSHVSK